MNWIAFFIISLLFIGGCSAVTVDRVFISSHENNTLEIIKYNESLVNELRAELANFTNSTECTICAVCDPCNPCPDDSYLSFEQYQNMSIRIKWLDRRLNEINNTDLIQNLEKNLTSCLNDFNNSNSIIESIWELIEE